ncbi:MAG TPA: translocation/assembly module TamB domain-containing protein, partial [Thermodesulfovibrionales bacterium]|nr:translocation/assembly module TamB domain-containing protein [Thermodesulfovibrionales bacterium]
AKVSYEKNMNLRSMIFELRKKKVNNEQPLPFIGNTELNIYIAGKKNLWINNNIAKLPFEVDVILKGTVDHPLLFGRVEAIDGTFIFSRNDFKVISAAIYFVSPDTIKPVMDLHASTEVRGYMIDMRLSGPADKVDLSLSSDPSLSETDILALLTTGQTASEASETIAEVGAFEATVFLTAPIQEKLEKTISDIIKIDRFQVDPYYSNSTSSAGARLTVGKRLMDDRLYVTYTTGLTTVEELIKLEYLLSRNVFLVGERDELGRMSGDIKFRFEFK